MSAEQLHADALIAIAAHTVEARRTGDTDKLLVDVEHVLSSLIALGAVPKVATQLQHRPAAVLITEDGQVYP